MVCVHKVLWMRQQGGAACQSSPVSGDSNSDGNGPLMSWTVSHGPQLCLTPKPSQLSPNSCLLLSPSANVSPYPHLLFTLLTPVLHFALDSHPNICQFCFRQHTFKIQYSDFFVFMFRFRFDIFLLVGLKKSLQSYTQRWIIKIGYDHRILPVMVSQ